MEELVKRGRAEGFKPSVEARFRHKLASKKRSIENKEVCGVEIRPIIQLTKNGDFIARYDCVRDALKELGKELNRSDINHVCNGTNNRKSAFGFSWMYEEDYLKLTNKEGK